MKPIRSIRLTASVDVSDDGKTATGQVTCALPDIGGGATVTRFLSAPVATTQKRVVALVRAKIVFFTTPTSSPAADGADV